MEHSGALFQWLRGDRAAVDASYTQRIPNKEIPQVGPLQWGRITAEPRVGPLYMNAASTGPAMAASRFSAMV
jgi:hypothetical protein